MARNELFRVYRDEETMLKIYARRLRMADRKFEKREPLLNNFIAEYENDLTAAEITTRGHRVDVTTGIGVIDTMYSSMTAVDIEFITRNIGHGTRLQAIAAERALNQAFRDTKGQRRAKKAIKDALLVDQGWVKVYYDFAKDIEERERPEADVNAEVLELLDEAQTAGHDLTVEDIRREVPLLEEVEVVLRDRITIDYVPYWTVRYDPSAKQIEDIRWMAQYNKMPVEEVRQHPKWRAFVLDRYGEQNGRKKLDELKGDSTIRANVGLETEFFDELGADGEEDDSRVTIVEMWDLETGICSIFPKNRDDLVLYQWTNPLMFNLDLEDRNPFKPLQVRDDPKEFEGIGDMRVIKPSVDELKEYRTQLAIHLERTVPKIIGPARAMTEAGRKALMSQEWGEFIGLEEGHDARSILPLTPPPLVQEVYQVPAQIKDEMREATGTNEVLRGVFAQKRVTATETQHVVDSGERRQAERRGALEQWYVDIARTMLQLMQKFYDRDRILRYTDDLGTEFEWAWNNEDIALDADIDISITPRENLTRAERFNRAVTVMNLTLPLEEADRSELIRYVLREAGLREDEIKLLVKLPEEAEADRTADAVEAQALSARPQPFGNSPMGLNIAAAGAR